VRGTDLLSTARMTYNRAPLVPEDLNPRLEAARWKRSFTRAAVANLFLQLQKVYDTDEVLRAWPGDRDAELIVKSPTAPMKVSDFPASNAVKLLMLAPQSASAKLFALATTVDLSATTTVTFPAMTNFAAATFVPEAGEIPVRQGQFVPMVIGPLRKIALLAGFSEELANASSAEQIIGYTLQHAVARGLDAAVFSNTAGSASQPAGLLAGITPLTPTAGGGYGAMVADLRNLIAAISSSGVDTSSIVFLMSPGQVVPLGLAVFAGTPNPLPKIITAPYLAAGTVIAVATAGLVVGGDGGNPRIDISRQTLLNYADPASPIGTTGTPAVVASPALDSLQTDTIALRCSSLISWSAAVGAVSWLSGATW
jgi:hypothetical protein